MNFYEILLSIMEEKDLKIPDVARLSGLTDSTVRSIINRKNKTVALEVAFKLSKGLNVPIERLNGENHPNVDNNDEESSNCMKNFLDKLDFLMEQKHLNKRTLSLKSGIPYTTIDNWYKRGYEGLKLTTLRKLNDFFNTSLDYWILDEITDPNYGKSSGFEVEYAEMEHVKKYRDLDNHGRHIIDLLLKEEYERCKGVNKPKEPLQPFRIINYYQRLASAGTGQIVFDDIPTEMIQIPDVAKYKRVKYAIGVDGDSMYPDYCDGDVLLVEPTREIELGEVGIFMIDGKAFVKELGEKELISINPSYENIPLTANTTCLGRVIDKLESAELELDYHESDISELPSDSMRAIENDMRAHKKQDA